MQKQHQGYPNHLAWHETMEMHELVVYQAAHLVSFKKMIPELKNADLRKLYEEAVAAIENNLKELLEYYPKAPSPMRKEPDMDVPAADFALLLGFLKTSVRYYAFAITETATPQLRETLRKQLLAAIALHAKTFDYMYRQGYYPAYDLTQLLANDVRLAQAALKL